VEKILINTEDYNGKYIALESIENNTIIGSGLTPEEALKEAKQNGNVDPFIVFIPDKDIIHIYYVD
jgi:hypothetical protein